MYKFKMIKDGNGLAIASIPGGWILKMNEHFALRKAGDLLAPAMPVNGMLAAVFIPDVNHELKFEIEDTKGGK